MNAPIPPELAPWVQPGLEGWLSAEASLFDELVKPRHLQGCIAPERRWRFGFALPKRDLLLKDADGHPWRWKFKAHVLWLQRCAPHEPCPSIG